MRTSSIACMDFNRLNPLCFRHKEIGPPRKGKPYPYAVLLNWCEIKCYTHFGSKMLTDLIMLSTAFDAATADDNAASIVLAFFILPMVLPPSFYILCH